MDGPKDPGPVVAGRYRLIRALGSGGMGTVWLARDELLARQVAVKEVSPRLDMTEEERELLRERTLREARTAARLRHPNVVTIYDVVEDGGRPWIVMELLPARSLADMVQQDGPLTPQEAARVGLQVLAALRAAHADGVMHRDVKPGNVLIDTDGRAVLADFGVARSRDAPTITTSGVIIGSPSYIAPERARGAHGGPESDLWSLGATLYSAVEGRLPYDREGAVATLAAVITQDPDPPRFSGPLWPVISGLLRKDPEYRLAAADAEPMLRRIAEVAAPPRTVPLPEPAQPDAPAGSQRESRLESLLEADRTIVLRPPVLPEASPAAAGAAATARPLPSAPAPAGPAPAGPAAAAPAPAAPAAPAGRSPAPPSDRVPAALPDRLERQPAEMPAVPPDGGFPGRPARPYEPEPGSLRRPRRARRRPLAWAIAILAACAVAVVAVWLGLTIPGRHTPARTAATGSAATGSAARSPGSAPGLKRHAAAARHRQASQHSPGAGQPSPAASNTVSQPPPTQPPGVGALAPVPAGYHRYQDPTGFSIAVPDGWNVAHQGHLVYITDPSSARFLLIDQTDHPKADPLADWRQQEANRIGTYPGYQRVRLEAVRYPQAQKAADWEFTYDGANGRIHVLNRNVLANPGHAYALYWSAPDSQWAQSAAFFRVFAATFAPAPG